MGVPWLVEFPASRTAPDDFRRRLRDLSPDAEIVYAGNGEWWVGNVRPNAIRRKHAVALIDTALRMLAARRSKQDVEGAIGRLELALLGLQGWGQVAEYVIRGEPDARILKDYQVSKWLLDNQKYDGEVVDEIMGMQDAQRSATERDLADPDRARDAWRYAFTRSHLVTQTYRNTPKSGRTRIRTVA